MGRSSGGTGGGGAATYESPADAVPATPSAVDDEFTDAAIDPAWAWVNQGGASIAELAGYEVLTGAAPAGNDNLRCRVRAAPARPFTITGRVALTQPDNVSNGGLVLRESATGKLLTVGPTHNLRLEVNTWPSPTAFGAGLATLQVGRTWQYLRWTVTDTTITAYASADGVGWVKWFSQALTAFFTTAPDQFGFYVNSNGGTEPAVLTTYWIRKS